MCEPLTWDVVAIRVPLSQTSAFDVTPATRSELCGVLPETVIVSRYHQGTVNWFLSTVLRFVERNRSLLYLPFSIRPAMTVDRRETRYHPLVE